MEPPRPISRYAPQSAQSAPTNPEELRHLLGLTSSSSQTNEVELLETTQTETLSEQVDVAALIEDYTAQFDRLGNLQEPDMSTSSVSLVNDA